MTWKQKVSSVIDAPKRLENSVIIGLVVSLVSMIIALFAIGMVSHAH